MRRVIKLIVFILVLSPAVCYASNNIEDNFNFSNFSEWLKADFDTPGSGTTANQYTNLLRIEVSGTGLAKNPQIDGHNDAFYFLNPPHLLAGNAGLYISFTGDSRSFEADGVDVVNYISFIDGLGFTSGIKPNYSDTHTYDFIIDIGNTPQTVTLGTGDGGLWDNTGYFDIKVTPASTVPEPATAALFLLGIPLAFKRKRKQL